MVHECKYIELDGERDGENAMSGSTLDFDLRHQHGMCRLNLTVCHFCGRGGYILLSLKVEYTV